MYIQNSSGYDVTKKETITTLNCIFRYKKKKNKKLKPEMDGWFVRYIFSSKEVKIKKENKVLTDKTANFQQIGVKKV